MAQQTFVKVLFGGERMWCRVLERLPDDNLRVCVDNVPAADGAPYRSNHIISADDVCEWMDAGPKLHVVPAAHLWKGGE